MTVAELIKYLKTKNSGAEVCLEDNGNTWGLSTERIDTSCDCHVSITITDICDERSLDN